MRPVSITPSAVEAIKLLDDGLRVAIVGADPLFLAEFTEIYEIP